MAKTVQQAEAELSIAALEYADAYEAFGDAFKRNHDAKRYEGLAPGQEPAPLHPETQTAVRCSNEKKDAMCAAAHALREAVRREQRAEAL